jgi:uncharacterized damage-inducible protein DinB
MPKNTDVKTMSETPVSIKDMILHTWDQEYQTTLRLLKAYPEDKLDLKPHEKLRTAKELAWTIVNNEPWMINGILAGNFEGGEMPMPPKTMRDIISNYEKVHKEMVDKVRNMNDHDLNRDIKFFIGPNKIGDVKIGNLLSMMVLDQVHHRGQLSVYMRIAGAKMPSIYGPTADEPWM